MYHEYHPCFSIIKSYFLFVYLITNFECRENFSGVFSTFFNPFKIGWKELTCRLLLPSKIKELKNWLTNWTSEVLWEIKIQHLSTLFYFLNKSNTWDVWKTGKKLNAFITIDRDINWRDHVMLTLHDHTVLITFWWTLFQGFTSVCSLFIFSAGPDVLGLRQVWCLWLFGDRRLLLPYQRQLLGSFLWHPCR